MYLSRVLPDITVASDDNNYGSAATLDVLCLQALSKRIHYGKFVAEAKFRRVAGTRCFDGGPHRRTCAARGVGGEPGAGSAHQPAAAARAVAP